MSGRLFLMGSAMARKSFFDERIDGREKQKKKRRESLLRFYEKKREGDKRAKDQVENRSRCEYLFV